MLSEEILDRKIPDRGVRPGSSPQLVSQAPVTSASGEIDFPDPLNVPAGAPRVLAGFLVSYEHHALGQSWPLYQGPNLVGRSGAVAGADVELPHATVSSRHSRLNATAHPGRVVLTDFGSTNGSFVNDTPLVSGHPRELRDGDRLRFGLFNVIVKII